MRKRKLTAIIAGCVAVVVVMMAVLAHLPIPSSPPAATPFSAAPVYLPHEPSTDTALLTVEPNHGSGVVWFPIPPDAKITATELEDQSFVSEEVIECFGELWYRGYKFGYVMLNRSVWERRGSGVSRKIHVTYTFGQPFRVRTEPDLLVDPVIEAATSLSYGYVVNLDMAVNWRGYPHYQIERRAGEVLDKTDKHQYVVVVPEGWKNELMGFAYMKEKKGIGVYIATTEWIDDNYYGQDLPTRIREFVRDAFNTWSISYVLLAGGAEVIPPRYVTDSMIPIDAYYSCLDGDWADADKGGRTSMYETFVPLGDWLPEIALGRLPADNVEELRAMIEKIIEYESADPSEAWHQRVLAIEGWKDPTHYAEPWAYPHFDINEDLSRFDVTRLTSGSNLSSEEVIRRLNEGQSVVRITAHGGVMLTEDDFLDWSKVAQLQNVGRPAIWLSEGCSDTRFTDPENVPTLMLKQPQKGVVACIGSTWGVGMVHSHYYFFGSEFPSNESYGGRNALFRPGIAAYQGFGMEGLTWTIGPGGVFLGDPEMASWTGFKGSLHPKLELESSVITEEEARIKVLDDLTGAPIEGAVIRLINKADGHFIEIISDSEGAARFYVPGELGKHDFHVFIVIRNEPSEAEITVERIDS